MSHFGPPVAAASSNDPLFRMRAYQIAKDLLQAAWLDAKTLSGDPVTKEISGQLYAAIGSISANIGEGYSRSSGIDRVADFQYALGRCARYDLVRSRTTSTGRLSCSPASTTWKKSAAFSSQSSPASAPAAAAWNRAIKAPLVLSLARPPFVLGPHSVRNQQCPWS